MDQVPLIIGRSIIPPYWTAFAQTNLCQVHCRACLALRFKILAGEMDVPSRLHEAGDQPLSFTRQQGRIAGPPQPLPHDNVPAIWCVQNRLGLWCGDA